MCATSTPIKKEVLSTSILQQYLSINSILLTAEARISTFYTWVSYTVSNVVAELVVRATTFAQILFCIQMQSSVGAATEEIISNC